MAPESIIAVLGGGSFGTAVSASMARSGHQVLLYCRTAEQAASINELRENRRFFPGWKLDDLIVATNDWETISSAAIFILAFPARNMDHYAELLAKQETDAIIINLVKGLHPVHFTFASLFDAYLPSVRYVALKGPTFARPLFVGELSGLTCGTSSVTTYNVVRDLFYGSNIDLDFCESPHAVDALSAIKNVYAIALGLTASLGVSDNTTFLLVTRIIREIRAILVALNLPEEAMFSYCGLGDTLLTGLCDASRNRTFGFMLGRNIPVDQTKSDFLAEGIKAISILHSAVDPENTPLLNALVEVLEHRANPVHFLNAFT
jgi:glycerol-3-phosphate dehydrogenase (NAD(P)+)